MTQMLRAKNGEVTPEIQAVAAQEGLSAAEAAQLVAAGRVAIPANRFHQGLVPCGVGEKLRTKTNANIGTSSDYPYVEQELVKLQVALEAGADTIMDLSTGGELDTCRRRILEKCPVPLGTVPVYQAMVEAQEKYGSMLEMQVDDLFGVIECQAQDGVDFMTVHCGVTLNTLTRLQKQGRIADIVSRGGAFLAGWMLFHDKENPLYEQYDRLLEIALKYDITLSLGDGLRPGCLADATDRAQIQELVLLGELVDGARQHGVQVMVEGPGHVPLHQIVTNIQMQKSLCGGAPFYVLGPIVTDVAPGYDHLTSAIGGAVAAMAGADFLCYVTPSEHLGLPTADDVREGVIAARLAAHAGDIAKNVAGAAEWDRQMARARKALDWEKQISLALDPVRAQEYRENHNLIGGSRTCSMCGSFCAMDVVAGFLGKPADLC